MNRRRRKLRFVDPPPAPVYTGPESLAGFLFMEYAGSPSDKLGIVLLDRDRRVIGRELILNSNVTATCYTPEFVSALLKGSCSLVPFSYKPRRWSPWANHDPKYVMLIRNWLRQSGRKIHDHLMLFSDGRWRSYGVDRHVDGVCQSAEVRDP